MSTADPALQLAGVAIEFPPKAHPRVLYFGLERESVRYWGTLVDDICSLVNVDGLRDPDTESAPA